MKLSHFKKQLATVDQLHFILPTGTYVPAHFHITEVGQISKHFIDCGGTERVEKAINFQLWEANDFDHRLAPIKLAKIIAQAEEAIGMGDFEIEVEYQTNTINKFGLEFENGNFLLTPKQTNCLALDTCGIAPEKQRFSLDVQSTEKNTCSPGGNCC
jgi:hypothetical protein